MIGISYVISLLEVSSSFKLPREAASSVRKLIAGLPFDTRTRTFILLIYLYSCTQKVISHCNSSN